MKLLLTALLFLPRAALWAQQPQVMLTDSSRIETRWYPGGREVQEILTRKDRVHYRFYRNSRAQATTTSTYTKAERAVGITREYFDDGRLRYAIDHDRGRVVVAHEPVDAHQALRHAMKARADRFVAARYGDHFLRYQAVWNVRSTYLFNTVTGGGWTDRFGERPHTFKFCYDVKLDPAHVYPELLVFALDTLGRLIPDEFEFEEAYGFEFVGPRPGPGFGLDYARALRTARQKSGVTTGPLVGALRWERVPPLLPYIPTPYTGRFRFDVPVRTGVRHDLHPNGRSRITVYYDVYCFNPWTGEYVGKQAMETVREWEKNSGFSSGLRPRK